jgi:hypothetical protein
MAEPLRWTLADVEADAWLDTFLLTGGDLPFAVPGGWAVSKRRLRGGLRDGVDAVTVSNGALRFVILPTRGMGLWRGDYRGTFLGWRSPVVGPVHPAYVNAHDRGGIGWLGGFDEWLCRCGLASNGPPAEGHTLHGRIANTPARKVEVAVDPNSHAVTVSGVVEEGSLFGGRLRLTASYTTLPGAPTLTIRDVVENRSARPAEMQLLYHLNMGPPLLEAGARFAVPVKELSPLTARAAEGMDTFAEYGPPEVGFAEQVYAVVPAADAAGRTLALLHNLAADKAVVVRWAVAELPCFTVWKNTGAVEDGYVTGLEPATGYPNPRPFERQQGRVVTLPPGGSWQAEWSITVRDSAGDVAAALSEVRSLEREPVVHRTPRAGFSASA